LMGRSVEWSRVVWKRGSGWVYEYLVAYVQVGRWEERALWRGLDWVRVAGWDWETRGC